MIIGMPSEGELEQLRGKFKVFDVTSPSPTQIYSFAEEGIPSLVSFAEEVGTTELFVERMYIDKADLRITEDMYEGLKLDIIGGVQFDSHRFNRDLEMMDLSRPVELRIFAIFEGRCFGVHYVDPELDSVRRITPKMRVAAFAEERLEKLSRKTVIVAKKEDPGIERFCDVLLHDSMYKLQRDDNERFNYVVKLARRPGNDNLKKIVYKEDGSGFSTEKIRAVVALTVKKTDQNRDTKVQAVFKNE